MRPELKICVGVISGAHGVQGQVKIKSFTDDPLSIKRYKPITDEAGKREFKFKYKTATNNHLIAELEGVKDRDAAEALRNTKLFIERKNLPKLSRKELYENDLIGLVVHKDGKEFGKVIAFHNYGGGPFLEIKPESGASFMLPFNNECVPEVDMGQGIVSVNPPDGWIEDSDK